MEFNFNLASIEYDVEKIHHFLNPDDEDWDWSKYVKSWYPKLNKGDSKEKIKEFVIMFSGENKKKLQDKLFDYKKEFEKISGKIISKFKRILGLKEVETDKINILISLSPINPYNLEKKEFSVYWNFSIREMIAISIHEIFHFLYFEKWRKVFPKAKYKDFDPPNIIWHLSELVAPIFLNDKKIQSIFKYSHKTYDEYSKLKISEKSIAQILSEKYNKRKNFASFLEEAYNFVLKHENKIQEI